MTFVSLLLLVILGGETGVLSTAAGEKMAVAVAIFITSVILATACIANDNLQDLKTGLLVGATPWRQQVALIVGVIVGALVIPPILDLLYNAYGFAGALPPGRHDGRSGLVGTAGDADGGDRAGASSPIS